MTHLGSRECIATTAANTEFFAEYSGEVLVATFAAHEAEPGIRALASSYLRV